MKPKAADWYTEDGHWPPHTVSDAAEGAGHGGADPLIVDEFLRFVREGGRTDTSPVAARMAVAAGCGATESLRAEGAAREVSPLDPALIAYFEGGQGAAGPRA